MPKRNQPNKKSNSIPQAIQLTDEQIDIGISGFTELLALFQSQAAASYINSDDLEALTKRFIRLVASVFGSNSVEYEHYQDWRAYSPAYVISTGTPDHVWERQCQERYHDGAQSTVSEIQTILDELEQTKRLAMPESKAAKGDLELILKLCRRLPQAQKCLSNRRFNKPAFIVADEYDAQDLLHALLKAYFKYSVQEQPLGKLAGAASRADLAIEELETLVELKYARGPIDQQRIVKELAEDVLLYTACHWLKHFVYVVVNSQDLRDPEALEKLAGVKRFNDHEFTAHIVLV